MAINGISGESSAQQAYRFLTPDSESQAKLQAERASNALTRSSTSDRDS